MKPRLELLPDRVQYFLDGAQEAWELDSGSALALELYGDEARIAAVVDAPGDCEPRSHYRNRRATCLRLVAMADEIMERLPRERRAGMAHRSLHYVVGAVGDLAQTISYWTIEDEIDGGCMERYRDRPRHRDGVTNKRTARRLLSPAFIRRAVKKYVPTEADHLSRLSEVATRRARETEPRNDPELMTFYRAQMAAAQPRHDRMMAQAFPGVFGPTPVPRDQRKVIKRSLNVAINLLGVETVRSFLRGEEIRLIGSEAMLVLRKRGKLAARGHGCLSVALADRAGTTLADLCTYIDDTPTLDQLCGFALWMRAGEERAIMETANIVKLADGAKEHPLVEHHYATRRASLVLDVTDDGRAMVADPIAGRVSRAMALSRDQRMERADAYWARTKDVWLDAMHAAVIGHRNFHLYQSAGALRR